MDKYLSTQHTKIDLSNIKSKLAKNGTTYYYWNDSIGATIPFEYDGIKGELILLENEYKGSSFKTVLYNGKKYFIQNEHLKNNNLSTIFGFEDRVNWSYNIGDKIKDENEFGKVRDLTITAREHKILRQSDTNRHKYYQFKCNACGYDCSMDDTWIEEVSIYRKGSGCPVCASQKTIKGINDIATINPEMLEYIIDKEFAYTHTFMSSIKTEMQCPVCKYKKVLEPNKLHSQGFACPKCSEYISYPEKFMMSVLDQNNIRYKYQLSNAMFDWCERYKYDFYLYDYNRIIETHGEQHYIEKFGSWFLSNQSEIDQTKRDLAINNGIDDYIEIDCSQSNKYYISKSILNSSLIDIIDIDKTNFDKANAFAISSLLKEVCEKYDELYPEVSSELLADIFHIGQSTIIIYLREGTDSGFCKKYNYKHSMSINAQGNCMPIKCEYEGNTYYFRSKLSFKDWLQEYCGKGDYYYILKQVLDKDKDYHGIRLSSITHGEFNEAYDNPDIKTYGERFVLDIPSELHLKSA